MLVPLNLSVCTTCRTVRALEVKDAFRKGPPTDVANCPVCHELKTFEPVAIDFANQLFVTRKV